MTRAARWAAAKAVGVTLGGLNHLLAVADFLEARRPDPWNRRTNHWATFRGPFN